MPAGTTPIFVATPRNPAVRIATANALRDGTGTLGTLFTASANGAFFKGFRYIAEATTTAGMIRIFIQGGGVGNNEMKKELVVTAVTVGAGTAGDTQEWFPPGGIMLAASDVVKVGTHNAETFACWLEGGGDF